MSEEQNHRKRVLEAVTDRQLSSVMSNTKWRELKDAVLDTLPFPPPYQAKYVLEDRLYPEDFESDVWYWGDWMEGLLPYYNVEWIRVRPRYQKHRGNLIDPELADCTEDFITILHKYHIPYQKQNDSIYIYGYISSTNILNA